MVVRIGARPSPLSMAQTGHVAAMLADRGIDSELVPVTTDGDTDRRHLTEIGGTGVFAQALRARLAAGDVDLAVHSAKDLPTAPAPGLVVAAHPVREDSADVLVGRRLADLADGVRIGTGSPRRQSQLQAWAGEQGIGVEVVPIRGNVGTRLDLVRRGEVDAVVLAAAGLRRLGLFAESTVTVEGLVAETLADEVMLPAPAQGALALEVVEGNDEILKRVREIDDPVTSACVAAERALLARLEAGCMAPVGAVARPVDPCGNGPDLTMAAVIGRTVGDRSDHTGRIQVLRVTGQGPIADAADLGIRLADELLDRLDGQSVRDPGGREHGTQDWQQQN